MIKRIVEISSRAYHLALRWGQLVLRPKGGTYSEENSLPCEDLGVLIVDHPAATFSHRALTGVVEAGGVVVLCGTNHLPVGMVLPVASHTELVWRIQVQIQASRPTKKRLWKQIVRRKIRNQAGNLPSDHPVRKLLLNLADQVRAGDPDNLEGQAARFYWEAWVDMEFRRRPDGEDAVNGMLNYGYAILRAAVARALVGAGLNPALGLHHRHRSNAFCLADDLMEPMRPWVDAVVAKVLEEGGDSLTPNVKKQLLSILHQTVRTGEETGPLMVSLHRTCASLVRCLQGKERTLQIPMPVGESEPCT